jgi:hypothetical protein
VEKSRVQSRLSQRVFSLSLASLTFLAILPLAAQAEESVKGKVREGFNQPMVLSHLSTVKLVVGDLDKFSTDHGVSKEHLEALLKDELVPTHATICDTTNCCQPPSKAGGKAASGKAGESKASSASSKAAGCNADSTPLVYLKVRTVPEGEGAKTAVFNVNLSLVEKVRVPRNKQELMVAVWTRESAGRVQANVQDEIDSQVKDVMKDFRRDYSLANSADIGHGRKHPVKKDNPNMPANDDQ